MILDPIIIDKKTQYPINIVDLKRASKRRAATLTVEIDDHLVEKLMEYFVSPVDHPTPPVKSIFVVTENYE